MSFNPPTCFSLFLSSLDSSFSYFATALLSLRNTLDHAYCHCLTHVTDGETTKRWVVGEGLNTHRLAGNHLDDGSITGLDELGVVLNGLAGTTVDLLEELGELAGNVGSVAIQDRSVASTNLTRVVKNDDLGVEGVGTFGWVVLGVTADVSTTNLLDGDVLDVESDVVTWKTFCDLGVVHLDGFDFSGDVGWSEFDDHTGFDDTGFDSADWHSTNTTNLVNVLEWESESFVGWSDWLVDSVQSFEQSFTGPLATFFGLLGPTFVPGHVGGCFNHVVSVPS